MPASLNSEFTCSISYRTDDRIVILEDWLDENASGSWSMGVENPKTDESLKRVKVVFEIEDDKISFMQKFDGKMMVG
jgi:hypothetical protein